MDFGNLMSGLASAGQGLIAGQQYQQMQAETQMKQLSALAMRQKADQQATTAANVKAAMGDMTSGVQTADDQIKVGQALITKSALSGDMAGITFGQSLISNGEMAKVREEGVLVKRQMAQGQKLADLAMGYEATQLPEAGQELRKAAVLAGVPERAIPQVTDPKFPAWAKEMETRSAAGLAHLKMKEDAQKAREALDEKIRANKEREAERVEAQRTSAALRQGNLDVRRFMAQSMDEARKAREADKGGKTNARSNDREMAQAKYLSEIVSSMEDLSSFGLSATDSGFTDLHGKTLTEALVRLGVTASTPDQQLMFRTAGAGMIKALGMLEVSGPGSRGMTAGQIKELESAYMPTAGDSPAVAMYKLSTIAKMASRALETRKPSQDPETEDIMKRNISWLESFPSPAEIRKASEDPRLAKEESFMDRLRRGLSSPTATTTAPAPAALPAGWK